MYECRNSKVLEEIHLSGNVIKKKTGAALCHSIEYSKTLKVLDVRNCNLKKATLVELIKILRRHKTIKKLDIAMNTEISSEIAADIEQFLQSNEEIEDLNIAACQLSSQSLTSVMNGAGKSTSLKRLHLDFNKVGRNMIKLAETVKSNPKLEEITLRSTEVSNKDVSEFLNILGPNISLRRLALERNDLDREHFVEKLKQFSQLNLRV